MRSFASAAVAVALFLVCLTVGLHLAAQPDGPPAIRIDPPPPSDVGVDVIGPDPVPTPVDPRQRYLASLGSGERLLLVCAKSCRPCELAKKHDVPWLEAGGWKGRIITVQETDSAVDSGQTIGELLEVGGCPVWILVEGGREIGRVEGRDRDELNALLKSSKGGTVESVVAALAEHLQRAKTPERGLRGPLSPTVNVLNLLQPFAGRNVEIAGAVSLTVPKPIAWQVQRGEGFVRLVLNEPPKLEFKRWVFWTVSVDALVITVDRVLIELGGFPDFSLGLDWGG